jgi:hypothetical protein
MLLVCFSWGSSNHNPHNPTLQSIATMQVCVETLQSHFQQSFNNLKPLIEMLKTRMQVSIQLTSTECLCDHTFNSFVEDDQSSRFESKRLKTHSVDDLITRLFYCYFTNIALLCNLNNNKILRF